MIYLLLGENLFARDQALARIIGSGEVERYSGEEIDESRLVDIFAGATLFAAERTVVIDGLSANKALWSLLPDRLASLDDRTTVVLLETRLDRRTKAYRLLQKHAKVVDCSPWTVRQSHQAEKWLAEYALECQLTLTAQQISQLVARSVRPSLDDQPIIDQALLATVVDQLLNAPKVTDEVIDTVMAGETHDNVFGLLEAALAGDHRHLDEMIGRLEHHQDGHRVMALLSSQSIQLAGLVLAREAGVASIDQVASDLGAHPYALRQISGQAKHLDRADARRLVERMAWADERLKRGAKPWQLIVTVLHTIKHPA